MWNEPDEDSLLGYSHHHHYHKTNLATFGIPQPIQKKPKKTQSIPVPFRTAAMWSLRDRLARSLKWACTAYRARANGTSRYCMFPKASTMMIIIIIMIINIITLLIISPATAGIGQAGMISSSWRRRRVAEIVYTTGVFKCLIQEIRWTFYRFCGYVGWYIQRHFLFCIRTYLISFISTHFYIWTCPFYSGGWALHGILRSIPHITRQLLITLGHGKKFVKCWGSLRGCRRLQYICMRLFSLLSHHNRAGEDRRWGNCRVLVWGRCLMLFCRGRHVSR